MTRTPAAAFPSSPSLGCCISGSGGRMSAALVTETDAGKIMGKMSWIRGSNEAILLRYP